MAGVRVRAGLLLAASRDTGCCFTMPAADGGLLLGSSPQCVCAPVSSSIWSCCHMPSCGMLPVTQMTCPSSSIQSDTWKRTTASPTAGCSCGATPPCFGRLCCRITWRRTRRQQWQHHQGRSALTNAAPQHAMQHCLHASRSRQHTTAQPCSGPRCRMLPVAGGRTFVNAALDKMLLGWLRSHHVSASSTTSPWPRPSDSTSTCSRGSAASTTGPPSRWLTIAYLHAAGRRPRGSVTRCSCCSRRVQRRARTRASTAAVPLTCTCSAAARAG